MVFPSMNAFYDSRYAILKYLTTFPDDVDEESAFFITSLIKESERELYDLLQVLTELTKLSTYPSGTAFRSLYFLPKDISDKILC